MIRYDRNRTELCAGAGGTESGQTADQSGRNLALRENPLLTQVLSDPRVRFAEKEKCLDRIFTPPFSSFMKVLCKHERVYALTEIFEAYQDLCRQKAGTVRAQLLCVEPPSAEQTEKMRAFVKKKKFGAANVELDIAVQPDLLGGFILPAAATVNMTAP